MPAQDDQRLKIRLKFPDREKFARLYERELSRGGIFLKTPQLKPIGTEVEIHLLPKGTEVGMKLIGQIIHVVTPSDAELTGGAPGMGVRFFDLDAEKRRLIDAYVAGQAEDFVDPQPVAEATPEDFTGSDQEFAEPVSPTPIPGAAAAGDAFDDSPPPDSSPEVLTAPDGDGAVDTKEGEQASGSEEPDEPLSPADRKAIKKLNLELDEIEAPLKEGGDFYKLLAVNPNGSQDEIKDAFMELKKRCHPDRFTAKGTVDLVERANAVYSEINKAYLTLSQPGRRAAYNIMTRRYNARYQSDEEEEAHRQAAREFRRKYVEKFDAKVRKAEMFLRSAKQEMMAGRLKSAKNNLKLALSFDPLNEDYRDLLIKLESGEFDGQV